MPPLKKGRSAGQALWPAAKAFGQKTRRPAVSHLVLQDHGEGRGKRRRKSRRGREGGGKERVMEEGG